MYELFFKSKCIHKLHKNFLKIWCEKKSIPNYNKKMKQN